MNAGGNLHVLAGVPDLPAASMCLDCGGLIAPVLTELGSIRCHDCRLGGSTFRRFGQDSALYGRVPSIHFSRRSERRVFPTQDNLG